MKENVQIVNVSHEEWLRLWQSTKERSFSVDERDNEWIFAEARKYDKPIFKVIGERYYLITY